VNSAPEYYSRHIEALCGQSAEFDGIFGYHQTGGRIVCDVLSGNLELLIMKFCGFKERDPIESRVSLPVASFSFPSADCTIDLSLGETRNNQATFRVDVPGVAGGEGRRRKVVLTSAAKGVKESIQAHVMAATRLRTFCKGADTLLLVEIIGIEQMAYPVGETHKRYWQLPAPKRKVRLGMLGGAVISDRNTNTIRIEKRYWASFTLDLLPSALLAGADVPVADDAMGMKLSLRSQSLSSFVIDFYPPVGTLYELTGANPDSLHLFVSPEQGGERG
jgi:hypothetical protein